MRHLTKLQPRFLFLIAACWMHPVAAEEIGSVNTEWKMMGSHKLVVDVYDDPKVEGVACYVAMPKRGGIAGAVGVAEEVSDVSIACRQVGAIRFKESIPAAGGRLHRAALIHFQDHACRAHGGYQTQHAGLSDLYRQDSQRQREELGNGRARRYKHDHPFEQVIHDRSG